jgi:Cdc6-like AAA superfamily ATPase
VSAQHLAQLDAERAFFPRGRFHELALDYVPFDELTAAEAVDGRIDRALRAEAGCLTVIAPSGGGKSAVIAAAAERLSDKFRAVRIPVAAVGDVAAMPVPFAQHIIRETVRQADAFLKAHQRDALNAAAADAVTVHQGSRRLGGKLRVGLPVFSAELAADLGAMGTDHERAANATDVIRALERLVAIFESRGGPPILIFEDTDAWVGRSDGDDGSPANLFFSQSLGMLARDVDVRTVLAVHTSHVELDGYRAIRDRLLSEVAIPPLPRPRAAIESILQRRIDVSGVTATAGDVFTDDALTRLVAEYDHAHRSLRRVLQVCDTALEQAAPTYPERLTESHVRGASVALAT